MADWQTRCQATGKAKADSARNAEPLAPCTHQDRTPHWGLTMPASDAVVHDTPGGYVFRWPTEKLQIAVKRLSDNRRDQSTSAEIRVESLDPVSPGHIHQARVNLTSTQAKNSLIKQLKEANEVFDWPGIVETLCFQTLELHRMGEPLQMIGDRPLSGGAKYRLRPLVPEGMPAIIFGEGGTGKSFIALLAAILVQSGTSAMGLRPTQGNVLYLDYETSAETQNERVKAICAGMSTPVTQIAYRYCYHPLAEDIETIQDMVADKAISFLIVDSLGPSCGGDPNEAELAIRMFNALRQLRVSSLLIDHVAKNVQDGQKASPYGSVYKTNLARSVWQIKPAKDLEDFHTRVGLYHRKVNFGPLQRDGLGFGMVYENDQNEQLVRVQITSIRVSDDADLAQGLSLRRRIEACLAGRRMTQAELALELEMESDDKMAVLRTTLNRGKGNVFGKWGDVWGLLAITQPQGAPNTGYSEDES
jgi:hypothetical protein